MAPSAKSGAWREASTLRICDARQNGVRSALEAGVGLAVIEQVADAVHRVLEDRGGGKHDHSNRWIDERDDVEGGHKTGDLADEAEVFECFHGDRRAVSTAWGLSGHRKLAMPGIC